MAKIARKMLSREKLTPGSLVKIILHGSHEKIYQVPAPLEMA